MSELLWQRVKGLAMEAARDHPCYEAEVSGGKYRVAPVIRHRTNAFAGYEAFFIPHGSKSAADVRNLSVPSANLTTVGPSFRTFR